MLTHTTVWIKSVLDSENFVNPHPSGNLFVSLCYAQQLSVTAGKAARALHHYFTEWYHSTMWMLTLVIIVVIVSISPYVQNKCSFSASTATKYNSCLFPLPGWERGTSDQTHTTNCCLNVKEHRQALWLWSHVSVFLTLRNVCCLVTRTMSWMLNAQKCSMVLLLINCVIHPSVVVPDFIVLSVVLIVWIKI